MRNHQDIYFLINVACRSECQHDKMAACCYFRQFRVVENDLKLFCNVYIMLCHVSDPNLRGGGADCFHPKWAVDSIYSWNVHCFQIQSRICHSVGIGIKGSSSNWVNAPMNPVNIVARYSRWQKCDHTEFFLMDVTGCLANVKTSLNKLLQIGCICKDGVFVTVRKGN